MSSSPQPLSSMISSLGSPAAMAGGAAASNCYSTVKPAYYIVRISLPATTFLVANINSNNIRTKEESTTTTTFIGTVVANTVKKILNAIIR